MSVRPITRATARAMALVFKQRGWDSVITSDDVPDRYLAQLRAAMERHDDCQNWASLGALQIACAAVCGESEAREVLDTSPAWTLDEDGALA